MSAPVRGAAPTPARAGADRNSRRAAASAFAGSAVEYYDFTLFVTAAALFLRPVFFAPLGPAAGTLASLATFGVAFVARPLGAILFGHLGDRVGRRTALVATVALMGVATCAIGLLPGYASWGVASPILLVVLRLAQGLSAGGEQAGSNALTVEHAPEGRRAEFAAWTMQGTSLGTLLGKVAFLAVVGMPRDALLAWGWRVPFLVAGPLLLVAWWIRAHATEPEAFLREHRQAAARHDPTDRCLPAAEVIRRYPATLARVTCLSLVAVGGPVLMVYGLSLTADTVRYGGGGNPATGAAGDLASPIDSNTYLLVLIGVTAWAMLLQPLWARLSDRVGRRPVFAASLVCSVPLLIVCFDGLLSGSVARFALGAWAYTTAWSAANAVGAALFAEQFPTRVRYTGTALATQLGMIVAGFSPTIMAALQGPPTQGWLPAIAFAAACLLIAATATLLTPETRSVGLRQLGQPRQQCESPAVSGGAFRRNDGHCREPAPGEWA